MCHCAKSFSYFMLLLLLLLGTQFSPRDCKSLFLCLFVCLLSHPLLLCIHNFSNSRYNIFCIDRWIDRDIFYVFYVPFNFWKTHKFICYLFVHRKIHSHWKHKIIKAQQGATRTLNFVFYLMFLFYVLSV